MCQAFLDGFEADFENSSGRREARLSRAGLRATWIGAPRPLREVCASDASPYPPGRTARGTPASSWPPSRSSSRSSGSSSASWCDLRLAGDDAPANPSVLQVLLIESDGQRRFAVLLGLGLGALRLAEMRPAQVSRQPH